MDTATKEKYDLQNVFETERKLLLWFGMYPIRDGKYPGNKYFYILRGFINIGYAVTFFLGNWFNLYLNLNNPQVFIETIYYTFSQTAFVLKFLNIHLRYAKFKSILEHLKSPMFNNYTEEQFKLLQIGIRRIKILGFLFRGSVSLAVIFFSFFPFIDGQLVPVPTYTPFSPENWRYYVFIYEMIPMTTNGYLQSGLDIILCALITIGSGQFEVLKDNLRKMREGLDDDIENMEKNDAIVNKRLAIYVQHHNQLIQYFEEIESMFSWVQFIQFLTSSMIICITGFQMILISIADSKFTALFLFFCCNFIEVAMCCWFGHDIRSTSEGVIEAIYMSDWYLCGKSVCTSLFIIMERAKRPITLTAGKFVDLTMQTMMQVMKTSYSYLALLIRLNEKNNA